MARRHAPFAGLGDRYGEELARGLRFTGYPAAHFSAKRIERVRALAAEQSVAVNTVLDFGCGAGSALPTLRAAFPGARVIGFEPEPGLRDAARAVAVQAEAEVLDANELAMSAEADLVYCNGVFHHIERADRIAAIATLARALRPGGLACIWDNSPLNPGTRFVMSRIPFDRGAILLGPRELEVLELSAGLTPIVTEFHFVFPRWLRALDGIEPALRRLPVGGQFLVAGRRA